MRRSACGEAIAADNAEGAASYALPVRDHGGPTWSDIAAWYDQTALIAEGFRLEAVDEPRASPRLAAEQPVYAEVPIFFGARAGRV